MSQNVFYRIGKGIGVSAVLILIVWGMVQCQKSENRRMAESTRATNERLEQQLPDGCTMKYLGVYDRGSSADIPVLIVRCRNAWTENLDYLTPNGKFKLPASTIIIEDGPPK